jgi:vacuolar-type H+-ATPase subunit H
MNAHDDDVGLLKLVLRLAHAHVERAEEGLEDLRGKGKGAFIDDRRAEIEAIRERMVKAGKVNANETSLDCAHNLMREVERLHDAIIAAVAGVDEELARWMATAGVTV